MTPGRYDLLREFVEAHKRREVRQMGDRLRANHGGDDSYAYLTGLYESLLADVLTIVQPDVLLRSIEFMHSVPALLAALHEYHDEDYIGRDTDSPRYRMAREAIEQAEGKQP